MLNAQERVGDFLRRRPRTRRVVRSILRTWEHVCLVRRMGRNAARGWHITRTAQYLPESQFGEAASKQIGVQAHTGRLYAIHRGTQMTLAAAAFEQGAGPGGSLLLTELALSRPGGERLDPMAYAAGMFLLERLHDVASKLMRPTDLWLESCRGATRADLLRLGFEHTGFGSADPEYRRIDSADPRVALTRLWRMARR